MNNQYVWPKPGKQSCSLTCVLESDFQKYTWQVKEDFKLERDFVFKTPAIIPYARNHRKQYEEL